MPAASTRRACGLAWLQVWALTWCLLSAHLEAATEPFRAHPATSPVNEAWFEQWRQTSLYAECAFLVHSSDRSSSRRFWNYTLASTVAFVPVQICSAWYFTYDYDNGGELPGIVAQIEPPSLRPHLIRRGDLLAHDRNHSGHRSLYHAHKPYKSNAPPPSWWETWSGAIQLDLTQVKEKWVFHVMDDTLIPGPIKATALTSILRAAAGLNASYVNLHNSTWRRCLESGQVMHRLKPQEHEEARLEELQKTHAIELWLAGTCSTQRANDHCTCPSP